MQTINKKILAIPLLLIALSACLVSFSPAPGGDKFEIYLNNKLIVEQYVSQKATAVKYLTLYPGNYNSQIDVYYSHCGHTGTDRKIIIKDENNRTIKTFEFANAKGNNKAMSWKVKDIMDLQKGNEKKTLQLIYTSHELPGGKTLASVVTAGNNVASVQ